MKELGIDAAHVSQQRSRYLDVAGALVKRRGLTRRWGRVLHRNTPNGRRITPFNASLPQFGSDAFRARSSKRVNSFRNVSANLSDRAVALLRDNQLGLPAFSARASSSSS